MTSRRVLVLIIAVMAFLGALVVLGTYITTQQAMSSPSPVEPVVTMPVTPQATSSLGLNGFADNPTPANPIFGLPTKTLTGVVGQNVRQSYTVQNAGVTGKVTYRFATTFHGFPQGLTVNPSTGIITGIPTEPFNGDITLVAETPTGGFTTLSIPVVITTN